MVLQKSLLHAQGMHAWLPGKIIYAVDWDKKTALNTLTANNNAISKDKQQSAELPVLGRLKQFAVPAADELAPYPTLAASATTIQPQHRMRLCHLTWHQVPHVNNEQDIQDL